MSDYPHTGPAQDAAQEDVARPGTAAAGSRTRPPAPLAWAYWILIAVAVVLLTSGFVGLFGTGGADTGSVDPDLSADAAAYLERNWRFVAVANTVCAVALGCLVPQMASGSQWGRRIVAGVMGLACLVNIGAIALGVGGMALLVIPVLMAVAALLMFRPAANSFVQEKTWEKRRIID